MDYGRFNPSIDRVFGALSSVYWSSTSYAINSPLAWTVRFNFGHVAVDGKDEVYYVRAVRGP